MKLFLASGITSHKLLKAVGVDSSNVDRYGTLKIKNNLSSSYIIIIIAVTK